MLVIIALLLKPNGGDRPIALAPFVFRIWTALFVPVIEQWDPSFIEHWDTAVKGSSALRAALARLVKDEIAQHYGQFILSTLWDASKFYDCLDLRKILKEAGSAAMPAAVIRICLTMYLAPRVIKVDTAFGTPFAIYNSILQGCRFANRMCRFGLYGILRDMHHFWPETGPMQYVDDLAQRAAGALHVVHGSMHESGVFLIEAMRRNKIQVSEKPTIVASSTYAANLLKNSLFRATGLPLRVAKAALDLGLPNAAAKFRCSRLFRGRLAKNRPRLKRIESLTRMRARGWAEATTRVIKKTKKEHNKLRLLNLRKLFTTGAWPAITYGHQACGISDADLRTFDLVAARASGLYRHGACTLTVNILAYGDRGVPGVRFAEEHIREWINFWRGADDSEKAEVRKVWRHSLPVLGAAEHMWKHVKGFITATIALLFQYGWRAPAPDHWIDHNRE